MDCMKSFDCCQKQHMNDTCDKCTTYDAFSGMPLAMAYVPWQQWQNVYDGAKGLKSGTIFEELIFPFECASPVCRGNCRRGTGSGSGNVNCQCSCNCNCSCNCSTGRPHQGCMPNNGRGCSF